MGLLLHGHIPFVAALCTPGTSAIPDQDEINFSPTDSWVGAKWDSSDGEIYFYEATSQGFGASSGQSWIGSCANTEYDGRWIKISGNDPDVESAAVNVWTQMSVQDLFLENRALGANSLTDGVYEFQLRRRSDNQTILTDQFALSAETEEEFPK